MHFLCRRSHNFIVWSWEPEMTCRGPELSEVNGLRAAHAELKKHHAKTVPAAGAAPKHQQLRRRSAEHQRYPRQSMSTTERLLVQQDAGYAGQQRPEQELGLVSRVATQTDLRVSSLRQQRCHGVVMASEHMNIDLRPNVPHPHRRVTSSRHEHVDGWVKGEAEDSTEMPVVVPDDLHMRSMNMLYGTRLVGTALMSDESAAMILITCTG